MPHSINNNNNNNEPFAALRAALNRDLDTQAAIDRDQAQLDRERDRFQRLQQDLAEAGERAERRGLGGHAEIRLGRGMTATVGNVGSRPIVRNENGGFRSAHLTERQYDTERERIRQMHVGLPPIMSRHADPGLLGETSLVHPDERGLGAEVIREAEARTARWAEIQDAHNAMMGFDIRPTSHESVIHAMARIIEDRDEGLGIDGTGTRVIEVLPEFIQENLREHFMMTKGTENYECPVCMGDINIKDTKYKKCGHAFCGPCLERCGATCAVCRQ